MKPLSLTALMYHYVRDGGDAAEAGTGIPGWPTANFAAQLDYAKAHYNMVSWADVRAHVLEDKPLPEAACLLTFDDGVSDHYLNVFPALEARGMSGLFFALAHTPEDGITLAHKIHFLLAKLGLEKLRVAVQKRLSPEQLAVYRRAESRYALMYDELDTFKGVMQRDLSVEVNGLLSELFAELIGSEKEIASHYYLTPAQIKEMAAGGMHFGGHSHSHPWFDWIDTLQQTAEIDASAKWLSSVEPGPWPFAYPYGGLKDNVPTLLQAQNFAAAFTTKDRIEHTDAFYIGRLDGEGLSAELKPLSATVAYS